ncbi:MAG: hypothetical protein PF450_06530 [Bacteroidales bacterium]|jgi:hypothetical protein|nr:hypothetical protein [Bacteroidales bacterium]
MTNDKLSKLEQVEKKAQDALRKAKAELKKERDELAKVNLEKRNKKLISLAGSFLKLSKSNPDFLFKVLEQAEHDLTPEEFAEIQEEFPSKDL